MCASLRRTVSHIPSPELRSGWAERKKISPISSSGGAKRLSTPPMLGGRVVLDVDDAAFRRRLVLELDHFLAHGDRPLHLVGDLDLAQPDPLAPLHGLRADAHL